jgi:MspA protein
MLNSLAPLAAMCLLVPVGTMPLAAADPNPDPPVMPVADAPPPPDGAVASAEPGILRTPDGRTLTVSARNETQLPVPPLTNAPSSREYLVGGTFTGMVTGKGSSTLTGGTLEAGYQIGCGIGLLRVELAGTAGLTPSFGATGLTSLAVPVNGTIEVELNPGTVTIVAVDKKTFQHTDSRVSIAGVHIKIDGCVGQSFLRSYATLTSSTENTDDVVSYLGTTMAV